MTGRESLIVLLIVFLLGVAAGILLAEPIGWG